MLVTKSGHRYPSIELDTPADLLAAAASADVVWIDEPMLFVRGFDSQLVDAVCEIREKSIVLISGLSATSELGTFGTAMSTLLALADEVFWCKADCDLCGRMRAATRSLCVVEKKGEVLVGGAETYKAACPSCWTGGEVISRMADLAPKDLGKEGILGSS
jgi:thymidine kinase